jgi:hypothetical protein
MNEHDWLTCTDPPTMLKHLTSIGPLRMRELRLFAIACARRVEYLLTEEDKIGREALQVAEEMAAGRADPATIARLQERTRGHSTHKGDINTYTSAQCARYNVVQAAYNTLQDDGGPDYSRPSRANCPRMGGDWLYEPSDLMEVTSHAINAAYQAAGDEGDWYTAESMKAERAGQAVLLREVFGNPFRPVTPDRSWLTSDVLGLARGIEADRAFDRLPILADALEDAGCDNADVLEHCRGPGPHVRGCWVVDLMLGRG